VGISSGSFSSYSAAQISPPEDFAFARSVSISPQSLPDPLANGRIRQVQILRDPAGRSVASAISLQDLRLEFLRE
jgi:hypothetical protein